MAFTYSLVPGVDATGRGCVYGNFTATSVTTGAITSGFSQVMHATFSNNVSATAVTYSANTAGTVSITCASGEAGTFAIYGM